METAHSRVEAAVHYALQRQVPGCHVRSRLTRRLSFFASTDRSDVNALESTPLYLIIVSRNSGGHHALLPPAFFFSCFVVAVVSVAATCFFSSTYAQLVHSRDLGREGCHLRWYGGVCHLPRGE